MSKTEYYHNIIEALQAHNGHRKNTAKALGITERHLYRLIEDIRSLDDEILSEAVKSNKQKQKAQDINRIKNKSFREHARLENAVEEYTKEIASVLSTFKLSPLKKTTIKKKKKNGAGIVHWSDQHLNELVVLKHNKYDWYVAAKRLQKYVHRVKSYCKMAGITDVVVAYTGDLINSDRRLDELLHNAGNRSKASVLAVDLYQQAIIDLAQDFNLTIASVVGNESRMHKDRGWSPEVASDSYDFTIHEHLRLLFENHHKMGYYKHVKFHPMTDPNQAILEIAGQNVLLIHGDNKQITKEKQKSVQSIIGRLTAQNVVVNMVIWGHLHEASIADTYARSSSLVGSNDYNENDLGLLGRASQNFYHIHTTGGFDGVKIDLQDTVGYDGYNIQKRLECYNTKSADKVNDDGRYTVLKITI